MKRWAKLALFCTLLVGAVGGCGPTQSYGRVHGQVTFQSAPVHQALIAFHCDASGTHMTAQLDADGRYQVTTDKGLGLPTGEYKVAILPWLGDLPIGAPPPPPRHEFPEIPERYRTPETSGLKLVVNDGDNSFDVDMQL